MGITQRIDAITRIDPKYRSVRPPIPRSVKIELNSRCNYSCSFCVRSIRQNDSIDMSREFYTRVLWEMKSAGVEELGLFYINEPFTVPWMAEAITEAKHAGFPYVFLTTNGSWATPWRVLSYMAAGLDSLKFSINFADDKQFKSIARVSPKLYHKALEHLKAARDVRDKNEFDCGIYASAIAFDGEQGEQMRELVEKHVKPYVDEFYWLPLYGMSGASEAAGMKPQPGNPGRLDALRDPLPCWATMTEGHITADGKLSACCFGAGIDGDLIMADLNEVSFVDGWNSLAFRKLREAHLKKDVRGTPCEHCAAA